MSLGLKLAAGKSGWGSLCVLTAYIGFETRKYKHDVIIINREIKFGELISAI